MSKRAVEAALKHSCALCDTDVRHCGLRKSPRYCKDCKLFILGYEQAEKDIGWISVKERLPGPSEWVVACVKGYGNRPQCLALATYNTDTKEWHMDDWEDGEQEVYNPDYWMPIPKFNDKEENNENV